MVNFITNERAPAKAILKDPFQNISFLFGIFRGINKRRTSINRSISPLPRELMKEKI